MSTGKAFITWFGKDNCTPLYQGGACEILLKRRWWAGTIHCHGGCFWVHIGKRRFWVLMRDRLRPISMKE